VLLAAVIINPRRYSVREPSRRIERRVKIIAGRMRRRGYLDEAGYRHALGLAPLLPSAPADSTPVIGPSLSDSVEIGPAAFDSVDVKSQESGAAMDREAASRRRAQPGMAERAEASAQRSRMRSGAAALAIHGEPDSWAIR
jgi:membrane peptidoglycan carboxypeptidase